MSTDLAAVQARARQVSRMLNIHGGGVDVVDWDDSGTVRLRFNGLCTACWMRPITLTNIVEPAFMDLEGVERVEVDGVRYSKHATTRLAEARAAALAH